MATCPAWGSGAGLVTETEYPLEGRRVQVSRILRERQGHRPELARSPSSVGALRAPMVGNLPALDGVGHKDGVVVAGLSEVIDHDYFLPICWSKALTPARSARI